VFETIVYSLNWTQIVLAVGTAVAGGLAVWYRKRIVGWRKFWREVFEGLRSVPELKSDVKGIRYYVAPNGGGSLMDAVARTETAVCSLTEQMDLLVSTMSAQNDTDDEIARFHAGPDGQNTYVNQLYARWLAVGKAELLGWGYMNFVHPEDLPRVRRNWDLSRAEHRQYRDRYRLVSANGEVFEVDTIATPIPESLPTKRWVGSIRKVGYGRRRTDAASPPL